MQKVANKLAGGGPHTANAVFGVAFGTAEAVPKAADTTGTDVATGKPLIGGVPAHDWALGDTFRDSG
jgi:hypothetical protein